ncbi:MAG: polysaccharide biosynthesis/export family protein [Salinisphaera sp.]|nr:polysaccharide biosynthesis/export family protein [Salinisphaera sp.]
MACISLRVKPGGPAQTANPTTPAIAGADMAARRSMRGANRTATRGSIAVLAMVASIAGCSLPGYEVDAHSSPWYGGDSRHQPEQPAPTDYHPILKQITARLIVKLHSEHHPAQPARPDLPAESDGFQIDYPDYNYELGVGDVVAVTVFNHPALTNPGAVQLAGGTAIGGGGATAGRMVTADGTLYFPYVGTIQAAGRTVSDVRQEITRGLARVIRQPQVDVRVVAYRSQAAYVVGDVAKPCRVPITDLPQTVMDALVQCNTIQQQRGSSQDAAQPTVWPSITLIRAGEPRDIDLAYLYRRNAPTPALVLQDGDRVYLADDKRVYMVGEFQQQTVVPVPASGLSLARAIGAAGGLDVTTADPEQIYVVRGFIEKNRAEDGALQVALRPTVYHLDAGAVSGMLLAENFPLQPRDIVFAAPADLVSINRALALILPSLQLLFRTAVISDAVSN